jgi:hypothetical protein
MVFPPLHVDAFVAWFIRLAASPLKLRRFGPAGKTAPDESAIAERRRKKPFPHPGRKLDKQIYHTPAPPEAGRSPGMSGPVVPSMIAMVPMMKEMKS